MKLGIIVIHGMGNQKEDFADEMIEEINDRINDAGADSGQVCWESAFWADVLQPREQKLWNDLSAKTDMDYVRIRKFVLSAFGDAIAYQRAPWQKVDVYGQIHARIRQHLQALRKKMGDVDLPIIVIAHSLGCAMISDYIWDRQKEQQQPPLQGTSTERMEHLAGLVTFGCNLPLFSLAYDPVVSIEFPPATLPDNLAGVAKWLNFFDPDDVLGYPLKPLSATYRKAVTKDLDINAGGIFSSWNPLSHSEYWADDDFTEPVAAMIARVLKKI